MRQLPLFVYDGRSFVDALRSRLLLSNTLVQTF
jgi:hypothetical protein